MWLSPDKVHATGYNVHYSQQPLSTDPYPYTEAQIITTFSYWEALPPLFWIINTLIMSTYAPLKYYANKIHVF